MNVLPLVTVLFGGVTVLHKTDMRASTFNHFRRALMPWDGFSERIIGSFPRKFSIKALGRDSPARAT